MEEALISNLRTEIVLIYFMDIKDHVEMILSPEQFLNRSVFKVLKVYDNPFV
jgi:hypothetical protein